MQLLTKRVVAVAGAVGLLTGGTALWAGGSKKGDTANDIHRNGNLPASLWCREFSSIQWRKRDFCAKSDVSRIPDRKGGQTRVRIGRGFPPPPQV